MDECLHCTDCIYKYLCTPFEKLLYTKNNIKNDNIKEEDEEKKECEEECICFININEFNNEFDNDKNNNYTNGNIECIFQEYVWQEMSWNKYIDNLFDYIEDNTL